MGGCPGIWAAGVVEVGREGWDEGAGVGVVVVEVEGMGAGAGVGVCEE